MKRIDPSSQVMVPCRECGGSGFNVHDACRDKCNTCEYSIGDDDCSQGIPDFCNSCHGKKEVGVWKRHCGDKDGWCYPKECKDCDEPLTHEDIVEAITGAFIGNDSRIIIFYHEKGKSGRGTIVLDGKEWEVVLK